MYKLLVATVVDQAYNKMPKVHAVRKILDYHGFECKHVMDPLWIGWSSKVHNLIDIAKAAHGEYTHIMFLDGADVVVLDGPEEVMRRYFEFDHPWVFNAEPHIWSIGSFTPEEYPTPECIYRYLNSGASIGEIEHMLTWFDTWTDNGRSIPRMLLGDQDWYAERFIEDYPDAIRLDLNCELFQCMCGSLLDGNELCIMEPGHVYNKVTGTHPISIHFNGGDDITEPNRRLLWDHWLEQ